MSSMHDATRWDRHWVKVLPMPNRYPQDIELLEMQQVMQSRLLVHTSAYEVVSGMKGTIQNNGSLLISSGIIWSSIGSDYGEGVYIEVPPTHVVVPSAPGLHQLGVQIVRDVVGAGYNPILGGIAPLLWETPLDRVRVYARYIWDTPDTLPVLTIKEGRVIYYYSSRKNPLRDTLINTYMRELDGDYIVCGISVTTVEGWVHVGAGRAWIGGRPIEMQAQSIPYRDGLLQLCADGSITIEGTYTPALHGTPPAGSVSGYSAIVSSDNTPILIGNQYGVVVPDIPINPYLIPNRCMPLASLYDGLLTDIAGRLPTDAELYLLLSSIQYTSSSNNQANTGDVNHPLYRVRVINYHPNGDLEAGGIICLPRVVQTLAIPGYIPPHTLSVIEENTVRTDWIDSAPTPSTPPPPLPFVHVSVETNNGYVVYGYNLTPGVSYNPNPAPSKILRGTPQGLSITADSHGMLEYASTDKPIDLSGILPTTNPDLSIGIGQSFRILSSVMVGVVSLYLKAGYHGVVSICALQNNKPYGPALAWVGVSSTSTGWVDIQIGPVYLPAGSYALVSQSVVGSAIGRRHYLLPTLSGTPESTGSMNMLLSQDGLWESLPNMDLMYRIHSAVPSSTYRDRITVLDWGEPFDGYEYISNYHLAPGTYITCTPNTKQGGPLLGKVFSPRTTITLSEALFSTDTLFPTIDEGLVHLYITSKTGTWISKEELVGPYTSVRITLNAHIPEGSTITVYVNSASGWLPIPLLQSAGARDVPLSVGNTFTYQINGLSPTTSSTDINGVVRQVIRERVRIRVEMTTLSPEIQPHIWGIVTTTQ